MPPSGKGLVPGPGGRGPSRLRDVSSSGARVPTTTPISPLLFVSKVTRDPTRGLQDPCQSFLPLFFFVYLKKVSTFSVLYRVPTRYLPLKTNTSPLDDPLLFVWGIKLPRLFTPSIVWSFYIDRKEFVVSVFDIGRRNYTDY